MDAAHDALTRQDHLLWRARSAAVSRTFRRLTRGDAAFANRVTVHALAALYQRRSRAELRVWKGAAIKTAATAHHDALDAIPAPAVNHRDSAVWDAV